ncbi:amino acid adenylation domain-containing protein [Actinosynnema sp. NPDC023794]
MARTGSLHAAVLGALSPAEDAPACVGVGERLSRAGLAERSGRLAARLVDAGVRQGDFVGLFLERGPDIAVAVLGVLRAGAAFVPLGLDEPAHRRAKIVADCRPAAVVVHGATRSRFTHDGIRVLDLDGPAVAGAGETTASADPGAAAYAIYTSGSSGEPKGVVVEHRNLAPHLDWLAASLPLGPGDRLLQVAPYTFDAALTDFFWPLSAGATVVSLPEGDHLDPFAIATALVDQEITAVRLPPAIMPLLLDEPVFRRATHLRYLICGGDRLPAALARRITDALPRVRLFNRYGPTEAAVAVTYHEFDPAVDVEGDVPIGSGVTGTELRLADGSPLAPGGEGELLIGGASVARGYLGDPGLTAERFVELPPLGRVFRSGDRVRVDARGALVFLGRDDDQVQVAGHRVETGEVRTVLCTHPGVEDCFITARENVPGTLAAHVVAAAYRPTAEELRGYLRARLPRHMVPSELTFVDALPMTDRGKVDLTALRGSAAAGGQATGDPLRDAWLEVLGTAGDAGFLAAGGTSLQAARLANRLRSRFGVSVTTADILRHDGYHEFEAWFRTLGTSAPAFTAHRPPGADAPLSHLQERLWFMHEFAPDEPVYNFQAIYHFTGDLDEAALRAALAGIIDRHEVLRTTFVARDGVPHQVVRPEGEPSVTVVDLRDTGTSPDRRRAAARELAEEFVRRPFDVTTPPLIRWCLIRLDDHERWLVHSQSHLTHDGWSFSVFLTELLARYRAAVAGVEVELREPPMQCGDFAYRQKRWWDEHGGHAHLPYWLDHLRGVPPLALTPRPGAPTDQSGTQVRRRVSAELVAKIKDVSGALNVTPFMFCFAAWNAFVWTLTGQRDFAVGTAVVNRPWEEAERMLGCVLNNIAIRTAVSPGDDFRTLARRTADELLAGYAHDGAPLHAIVEELRLPRNLENPLFQTTFNFHDAPFPDLALPGVRLVLEEAIANGTSKFPIDVIFITDAQRRTGGTGGEEYDVVWHASARYFDAARAEAAADAFLALLATAAENPGVRLSDLRTFTPPVADVTDAGVAVAAASTDDPEVVRVRELVRAVWTELLGVQVGEHDNFFERGGHSLLAVRAVSRIRSRLGRRVPVRLMFEAQTLREFAAAVVASTAGAGIGS